MESLRANSARAGAGGLLARLLPAACCLLLSGCQNGRQLQADLYQRELRLQEDEIYRLEDYVEEYQAIVCSQREEISRLKRELDSSDSYDRGKSPGASRDEATPSPGPTLAEPAAPGTPISAPDPADEAPPFKPSPSTGEPLDAAPPFEGASRLRDDAPILAAAQGAASPVAFRRPAAEPRLLDAPPDPYPSAPVRTAGEPPRQRSATPGAQPLPATADPATESVADTALTLEVRPHDGGALMARVGDRRGSLREFAGTASVLLTDPTAAGLHKRVARWDFTAEEVGSLRVSGYEAIELPVALPETTPTDRPLRLWVRLVDRGGRRRLQATDVAFVGGPLRLAEMARRLPTAGDEQPPPAVADSNPTSWRPARDRRINDGAVLRASYETEVR